MALLGDRVPIGLKVFLTALAIVDDIAAVLVIAVFYTAQIDWAALGGAGLLLAVLFLLGRLWRAASHDVCHRRVGALAACAGVWSPRHDRGCRTRVFRARADSRSLPAFRRADTRCAAGSRTRDRIRWQSAGERGAAGGASRREEACEKVQPPLHRMEHALHGWVAFFIMPVFALANAGVALGGDVARLFAQPITLGVAVGLLIGKPLGITLASWVAVRTGLASLPNGVSWTRLHGAGWLGGIGFTMSLFVAGLAFTDELMLTMSKLGILTGSACAAIIGSVLLRRCKAG
jgi:NhaA family Na+:H+ antiporter